MALVLADVGADIILNRALNQVFSSPTALTLKLFTNDVTPADTDTAGTYTEATGGGYAAITLATGSWTVNAANDPSDAVYAEQTFTFTGPLTGSPAPAIMGYFIVDGAGVLVWAEKFTASFTPINNGDSLKLTPKIQLSKGTPT